MTLDVPLVIADSTSLNQEPAMKWSLGVWDTKEARALTVSLTSNLKETLAIWMDAKSLRAPNAANAKNHMSWRTDIVPLWTVSTGKMILAKSARMDSSTKKESVFNKSQFTLSCQWIPICRLCQYQKCCLCKLKHLETVCQLMFSLGQVFEIVNHFRLKTHDKSI